MGSKSTVHCTVLINNVWQTDYFLALLMLITAVFEKQKRISFLILNDGVLRREKELPQQHLHTLNTN